MQKTEKEKTQLNKIKKCFFAMLIIFVIIVLGMPSTKATDNTNSDKSELFKRWENLSEEERKNTVQPSLKTRTLDNTITTPNKRMFKFNSMFKLGNSVQSSYCLDKNHITVKNQRMVNSCWAFAFTSMLETTMFKKYNIKNEYSPAHIDYTVANMYNADVGNGGNFYLATAYCAAGYGPVYETEMPFTSVYNPIFYSKSNNYLKDKNEVNVNIEPKIMPTDVVVLPEIYKEYTGTNVTYKSSYGTINFDGSTRRYTKDEVDMIRNQIKQHIINYGAVGSSMYTDISISLLGTTSSNENYLNSKTNSYYCDDPNKIANHAITIIGWDDNYPASNFNSAHRPINNGAYIVLNSYGNGILDNGYFYISYDDAFIETNMFGIEDIEKYEDNHNESFDNLYQHDELGESSAMSFSTSTGYMANVFNKKESNTEETINAVGVYLWESEGIEIYINKQGNLDLSNAVKVATYTGTRSLKAGYHKIKLQNPVELDGNKFAVIVKYTNRNNSNALVSIECNLKSVGFTDVDNYFNAVTSNPGESYMSNDGNRWTDLCNLYCEDTGKNFTNTNACIKVFTKVEETEEPEPEPEKPDEFELGDVNKDKIIDITDIMKLKRHLITTMLGETNSNWKLDTDSQLLGDMDNNNKIDVTDIYLLKIKVLSLMSE